MDVIEGSIARAFFSARDRQQDETCPTRAEAENAVRTLIRWAGDDPLREGLIDTPARVVRAFDEYFCGYREDPGQILERYFEEIDGYDEMVMLQDIEFHSHCEHHLAPITGRAHVAYLPDQRVVGISKLARVVQVFARRMQIQEKMTMQIGNTIQEALKPRGAAVLLEASHHCMTHRGVKKTNAVMVTSFVSGVFRSDRRIRDEFFSLVGRRSLLNS